MACAMRLCGYAIEIYIHFRTRMPVSTKMATTSMQMHIMMPRDLPYCSA